MSVLQYRLTSVGRTLVETRRQEASPSEEVLELLLENPEQSASQLSQALNREEKAIKLILDQHIKHGRIIGVLEEQ